MMAGGERNLGRLTPMVLTGALAVLIGALLWGLTDISGGATIALVVLILAIGLVGVWMLDRRRVA
jgi:sulfite exporter TauE/SafE